MLNPHNALHETVKLYPSQNQGGKLHVHIDWHMEFGQ